MVLQAPNGLLFIISAFLAMLGILAVMPTNLSIPDLAADNAAWFIFLAWFMLAAASTVPSKKKEKAPKAAKAAAEPVEHAKPAMAAAPVMAAMPAAVEMAEEHHDDHAPAQPAHAH